MTQFEYKTIPAPSRGLNTAAAPGALHPEEAVELRNWWFDRPGRISVRAPLTSWSYTAPAAGTVPFSAWSARDKIMMGYGTSGGSGIFLAPEATPQEAAWKYVSAFNQLMSPSTTGRVWDARENTMTNFSYASKDVVPGVRFARVQNYVYGNALGTTSASYTIGDKLLPLTNFLKWDGTNTPPVSVYGPLGALDTKFHLQRLFVLGGVRADGTLTNPIPSTANLYFSDPLQQDGAFPSNTVDNWKDNVSGLYNVIDIGSDETNDPGMALAVLGRNLVIFKRNSVWMLYGDEPGNFTVRKVHSGIGLIDARSVVEFDDFIAFASDRGIYSFDGTTVTELSASLRNSLDSAITYTAGSAIGFRYVDMERIGPRHLFVVCGMHGNPTPTNWFCGYLSLERGAWSRFTSQALGSGTTELVPDVLVQTRFGAYGLTAGYIANLEHMSNADAGPYGGNIGNDIRDNGSVGLTAEFVSRPVDIGSPINGGQLHRVLTDYLFRTDNTNETNLVMSLIDPNAPGLGTVIKTEVLPSQYNTNYYRRRHVSDEFVEVPADIQYKLLWTGPNSFNNSVEFQSALLEYTSTRLRGTA